MMLALDRPLRPLVRAMSAAHAGWFVGIAALLIVASVLVARVSIPISVALAAGLLITIAAATARWPRAVLVLVVLAPILDRFVAGRLLPDSIVPVAAYFSEALLLLVAVVLVVLSARAGTLSAALRHPSSLALGAFAVIAILSTIANRVPLHIALIGFAYTVEAAILFYLVRMAGFGRRQVRLAIAVLVGVMLVASLLAIAQNILSPNILGLTGISGRSGEGVRIGSIVRDPNILGTLIGLTLPFAVFAMTRLPRPAHRRAAMAVTFVLTLALLLTFSRGSWFGVAAGLVVVALLLDRRALLSFAVVGLLAVGTGYVMPRGLLTTTPDGAPATSAPFNPLGSTIDRVGAIGVGGDLRWMFTMNAVPILADHPVVGVGPGRYGGAVAWNFTTPVYAEYGTDALFPDWYQGTTVDNFWLHILIETGVAGAAALIAAIGIVGVQLFRVALGARGLRFLVAAGILSAVLTVSVSTSTTMLLEGNTVAFMFWFLLGLGSLSTRPSAPRPVATDDGSG